MKTAPLEKPSYKGRKVNQEKSGNKPCKDGSRECCAQGSGTGGVRTVAVGQGVQSRPHRGTWAVQQQGIVSLWPLEHGGAVGTSQQVQAGQGVCDTSRVWWW